MTSVICILFVISYMKHFFARRKHVLRVVLATKIVVLQGNCFYQAGTEKLFQTHYCHHNRVFVCIDYAQQCAEINWVRRMQI